MRPLARRPAALLLFLPCLVSALFKPTAAAAQQISITAVSAAGVPGYTPADMAAATGLAPGTHTEAEVQKAADTLAASAQFASVGFAMKEGVLTFQLTPPEHALPVHFENFIWWSDAELTRLVHAKVPLFIGTLGGPGPTLDAVQATLTALARERAGADARVDSAPVGEPGQAPAAFGFTITAPPITIARVRLANDTLEMAAAVTDAGRAAQGQPYTRDSLQSVVLARLNSAYADAGYFDFTLKNLRAADPAPVNGGFAVTVLAELAPGPVYHVGQVHWAATPQLSGEDFARNAALKPGDTASQARVSETLRMIERNYQRTGYPNARASAALTLDRAAHTASYDLTVDPGQHTD